MQWACGAGILNTKGSTLEPKKKVSRAEVAEFIKNYMEIE